ncbi:MAG: hypothetical protein ABSA85_08025, partial [Terracidiphilus sp.]
MSRKCKHITVSVSQEQYYRARLLAAEYDTTVTALVATLLEQMPKLLRRTNYPKPNSERTGRSLTFQTGHMPDTFSLSGRFLFWSSGPGQACPGPEP